MPPFPTLIGPSASGASRVADSERTVGFYLAKNGPSANFPASLLPLPGLSLLGAVNEGPGRGVWAQDGRCLRVASYRLYEVDNAWAHTLIGSVNLDSNPAQLVSNGDAGRQVLVKSGRKLYVFDLDSLVFSGPIQIGGTDIDADFVGYLDNRFLALDVALSALRCSALNDGLTWSALSFVQRSTAGDRWKSMLVCGAYIYLYGSETTDVYYDGADPPMPYIPVPGAVIPVGIAAGSSAADLKGVPIWLAQTAAGGMSLVKGNGTGLPTPISDDAFDTLVKAYSTVADAEASVLEYRGHALYKLSFPTARATWVYDGTTGALTEWPYWNGTQGREEASLELHHASVFGSLICDDRMTGNLYAVDGDTYTDNGATIRRVRRVPIPKLTADNFWIFLQELELFMDAGVGVQTGADEATVPGSDPTVALRISRDGGNTWGHEITLSVGAIGDYFTRVLVQQLGRFRDGFGVIELVFTDPVPYRLHGGSFQAKRGAR